MINISTAGCYDAKLFGEDRINFLLKYNINGIEITFHKIRDLLDYKPSKEIIQKLKEKYVSIHAPSIDFIYDNNQETLNAIKKYNYLIKKLNIKHIVFHPSEIKNFEILQNINTKIAIENLHRIDEQYSSFEKIQKTLKKYPWLFFVLDTNHVYLTDKKFEEYLKLKDKIIGIHLASQWIRKKDGKIKNHGFLLEADKKQFEMIKPFLKIGKPLILESDFYPEKIKLIKKEIDFIKNEQSKPQDNTITLIFNKNFSKVLMLKRVKTFGFDWGYLSGKIDGNEKPLETTKREIKEEIGLKNQKPIFIETKKYSKNSIDYYHHYFFLQINEKTRIITQKEEIKQAKWFNVNNLPKSRAPDDLKEYLNKIKLLNNNMQIINFDKKYAKQLSELWLSPEVNKFTLSTKKRTSPKKLIEKLSKVKKNSFLAIQNKTVIGFASIRPKEGRMNHCADFVIFVSKEYYGKGIGKNLLEKIFSRTKELNLKRLEVSVFIDNKRATRFYEKNGFKEEGIKKKALQRDKKLYDEIIMAKFF